MHFLCILLCCDVSRIDIVFLYFEIQVQEIDVVRSRTIQQNAAQMDMELKCTDTDCDYNKTCLNLLQVQCIAFIPSLLPLFICIGGGLELSILLPQSYQQLRLQVGVHQAPAGSVHTNVSKKSKCMIGLIYNLGDMKAGFYHLSLESSLEKLENVFSYKYFFDH